MSYLKYKLYKNNNNLAKGKYYARAFHDETITMDQLAEHMSTHNTPFSKGTIYGVLQDMVVCARELMLDGKKVKLDNLAIFGLGLSSRPADTPQDFNVSTHIIKAYINAIGTGEISKKQLDQVVRFKEVVEYNRSGEEENPSDGNPSSGGSQRSYTLTLMASPSNGGSVSGGGQYNEGNQASISASAASGYQFVKWSDGVTNASRTVTVNADLTLTAEFTADSTSGGGSGTDEGDDMGM